MLGLLRSNCKMSRLLRELSVWLLVFSFGTSQLASGADAFRIGWADADSRVPFRKELLRCEAFLVPNETPINDSVGIPLGTDGRPELFRQNLQEAIAADGVERFSKARFVITGIANDVRESVKAEYQQILDDLGLSAVGASLQVMSIPRAVLQRESASLFQRAWARLVYTFPSFNLDFQKPISSEVIAGLVSTAVIEIPVLTLMYLDYAERPNASDFYLTAVTHASILVAMTVFGKFLGNWITRPGVGRITLFIKQALSSAPFIFNYKIFGNLTPIRDFVASHSGSEVTTEFLNQLNRFQVEQGLTLALQTIFYAYVVSAKIREWQNTTAGRINSYHARAAAQILQAPFLMLDSIALYLASTGIGPLLAAGPYEVNTGHAALVLLTVGSYAMLRPRLMDRVLEIYKGVRTRRGPARP